VLWRAREGAVDKPGHVSGAIVEGNSSDVAEENTTIELDDDELDSVTDKGMTLGISEYELTASNDSVRSEELANSEAVSTTDEGPRSGK